MIKRLLCCFSICFCICNYKLHSLLVVKVEAENGFGGGNVAAVNSLRQVSIPLSVILGGLYLKEADTRSRLLWAVVLAAGVVVIVLAR